jgi:1,4-alpha-glucan branching enzyme
MKGWIQGLLKPRKIHLRPVYGVAAAMILTIAILIPFYFDASQEVVRVNNTMQESVQQVSHSQDQVWVRFVYIDEKAQSIEVAGDFNGWEPIPLEKQEVNGEQVWTGLVSMNRGEHRYMFVKDGEEWVTDPMAPMQREDGFGNKNAVIYL